MIPMLPCDPGFAFDSNPISSPIVKASYTNNTGYAYVDMEVTGSGMPSSEWGGVVGSSPFTWTYSIYGYDPGTLTFKFVEGKTNGKPGNVVATCQIEAIVKGSPPNSSSSSSSSGGGLASCAQLAQANGWPGGTYTCDDGSKGWCAGTGTPTSDCAKCCGPSCGIIANLYNSPAQCDNGSNGVCNGSGVDTWDCPGGCCGSGIPNSMPPASGKFGYPVGDKSSSPAGGWQLWQVLGHYWDTYGGAHLAEDIGKAGAANAQVYSVADGTVLVSSPNSSSYVNVILVQHPTADGSYVCSFYGHLASRTVQAGQTVTRGQQIATLLDQGTNSHLHYFIAPKNVCDKIAGLSGGGACGYDGSTGVPGLGHADITNAPASYVAKGTNNGCSLNGSTILAPHNYIDANHF